MEWPVQELAGGGEVGGGLDWSSGTKGRGAERQWEGGATVRGVEEGRRRAEERSNGGAAAVGKCPGRRVQPVRPAAPVKAAGLQINEIDLF